MSGRNYLAEPINVGDPVVRSADLLSATLAMIDTASGITSAQRAVGAMPILNATKDALVWSAIADSGIWDDSLVWDDSIVWSDS